MLIDRRRDGSLVFNCRWDHFVKEWRGAPLNRRVVLDDGRPAVRRPPEEDQQGTETYTTIAPALWDTIKKRQREAFGGNPPPPRTRLCQACRQPMRMVREYSDVWCFKCDTCGSSETWGKQIVGGTRGAGEIEKR